MSYQDMPTWLHEMESNMRSIVEDAYRTLNAQTWWRRVATEKNSMSKKEVFTWLISTAMIRNMESGQAHFEDMLAQYTEVENEFASAGLILKKEQLEDLFNGTPGGEGLQLAARWARDIAEQIAYWPQFKVADAILDGASAGHTSYDGLTYFNTAHYVNGVDSGDGTFRNLLKPTGMGHATRIDAGVTLDAAIDNLAAVRAYIAGIKMPNGVNPRNLRIKAIIHPPAMQARVMQLCFGTLVAQDAASGGAGGADVSPIVKSWNLERPLEAPELGASYTSTEGNAGSDTTYYVVANESAGEGELGALVYQNREPFNILYHGPEAAPELARKRELQYKCDGRNTVGYGHPYQLFRVDAAD